jgi:hypothetical protein
MSKRSLWIVPIVGFVANGLAALPYGDGSKTCTSGSSHIEHVPYAQTRVIHDFLPYYSVRCEHGWFTFHNGTLAASLFWLLVAAVALVVAVRFRRSSTARAVGAAVLVLGVFGLVSVPLNYPIGAMIAVIATPVPIYAFERLSGNSWTRALLTALTLPFAAIIAWGTAWLGGTPAVAVACAIAASTAVAAVIRRVKGTLRLSPPPRDLFATPGPDVP